MVGGYLNTRGVEIANVSGSASDGQPQYGSFSSLPCRYEAKHRRIITPSGDQIVSAGRLFVLPDQTATLNAKVAYNGTTYRVVQIDEEMGFSDLSHLVLWLANA